LVQLERTAEPERSLAIGLYLQPFSGLDCLFFVDVKEDAPHLDTQASNMKLSELFEDHYKPRRLHGRSQNTVRLYRLSIESFGRTLKRPANVDDFTNENVIKHMQRLLDDGRSKATANKDRSQLLAMWRFATRVKLHDTWPEVSAEIEPERTPQAWLKEDLDRLFAVIAGLKGNLGTTDIPAWMWWRAIVMVCLDTAERIGAVRECRWDWLEGEWIIIPAEVRKGKRRDRRYKLSHETIEALRILREHATGKQMFPWPYCKVYLWKKYKELLVAAKLPSGRRDAWHRLRRTTASVIHAAGMDATDALDHTHRRTTQRYLDARFTRATQPSQILADWLRNPTKPDEKRKQA
jgi:integrase